jgi:integrase
LLGLRWERVDLERGKVDLEDPTLTIPHKGRAIVPMTRTLKIRLLEAQRGALTPFVIEWAGQPVRSVKKGLASATRRAGLPHVSPHQLRHTAAVHMAEAGVSMEEISAFLGHRLPGNKATQIYAKFSADFLRKAVEALELDNVEPMEVKRRAG